MTEEDLFCRYYTEWLEIYKVGSVRDVTLQKYRLTEQWLYKLIPNVKLKDMNRNTYQTMINAYAVEHEKQTVIDFHHQVKSAVCDAVDDGLISKDPTRKILMKGKLPRDKKQKFLSKYEVQKLIEKLDLSETLNLDWLIMLMIKTGMRFSEALAITPKDFDFAKQTLSINKTWDYKSDTGFQPTKNSSSVRKIPLDWQTAMQFFSMIQELPRDKPIFEPDKKKIYNSTVNDVLVRRCREANVPEISVHGLRHTHASLLLYGGVSVAGVSKRLGHSSINTTQKVYLHIIMELDNQDTNAVMRELSSLKI